MYGFTSYNIGVSDKESELEFVAGSVSHVFTTVDNASKYNIMDRLTKIKCQPLDYFDIQGSSIVLKIDVEGQELKVLEGASSFFDEKRIKAVYLDGFTNQEECLNFLSQYNFSFFDGKRLTESDGNLFSLLAISEKLAAEARQLEQYNYTES